MWLVSTCSRVFAWSDLTVWRTKVHYEEYYVHYEDVHSEIILHIHLWPHLHLNTRVSESLTWCCKMYLLQMAVLLGPNLGWSPQISQSNREKKNRKAVDFVFAYSLKKNFYVIGKNGVSNSLIDFWKSPSDTPNPLHWPFTWTSVI